MDQARDPAMLARGLGAFVPMPSDIAAYEVDAMAGAAILGATPKQVEALADAGLPHVADTDRGPLFDAADLINAGWHCGSGRTVPELFRRYMTLFVQESPHRWFATARWRLTVGPLTGTAAPAQVVEPCAGVRVVSEDMVGDERRLVVDVTGEPSALTDPSVRAVWEEVLDGFASGAVAFQRVGERFHADHRRAWALGAADCFVTTMVLADRLAAIGRRLRPRRGQLLGFAGSVHMWGELEVEGGAVAVLDPLIAHLALTVAPPSPDFAEVCFGGRHNRLLPMTVPAHVPTSLMARHINSHAVARP